MEKPKISVALATFNEEKNLPVCLDSVKGLAEEIVVVDGGSTDKTVAVAQKYGAKVIATTNKPIFHINKQMAIDACQGDWILQLDVDEQLTPELRREILATVVKTKFNGFWLPRKNYFLGRYLTKGGQYPDYTLRLYRQGKGKLPCQSVHEQAVVEGKVGCLTSDLLHHPFPNFLEYLNKANRYANLLANEYLKENLSVGPWGVIKYLLVRPKLTFFEIFIRHRGFIDGFSGFVFALFSAIQKMTAYIRYWEIINAKKIH